jgi:hypothetical protein
MKLQPLFQRLLGDSWPYLGWWEILNPANLLLCRRVRGYTQQNMAGLVNVKKLAGRANRARLEGAFVECGVWRGGCAGIMGLYAEEADRRLWLFDSFEGMPEASALDTGQMAEDLAQGRRGGRLVAVGTNVASSEDVRDLLHRKLGLRPETVVIRKGWFQHTVAAAAPEIGPIALLRIDGDWYASTKVCLEGLYDNVVAGGFVVIDDYGVFPGCKAAVDEFMEKRGLKVEMVTVDYARAYFQKPLSPSNKNTDPRCAG